MIDIRRTPCVLVLFATILTVTRTTVAQRVAFDVRQNGTAATEMRVAGVLASASGPPTRSKHHAVAVDGSGNVYVVGQIGGAEPGLITVAYDRRGIERWRQIKRGAASNGDNADAVAVDSDGNIYVAGSVFTGGTNPTHGRDAILISYDPDGNERWVKLLDSCSQYACFDDDFADVVVKTNVQPNLIYAVGTGQYPAYGRRTVFVAAYDSGGAEQWTASSPTVGRDSFGRGIALDTAGNVYVTAVLGGVNDFYTTSFTSAGAERWTPQVQDAPVPGGWNTPYAIAVGGGRVYVTGSTATPAGGGNEPDYYTVAYDTVGNRIWVKNEAGGGTATKAAWDVVADASGNAYVTGAIGSPGGCYTVKYAADATGTKLWERTTDVPGQICYAAVLDQSSNVYLAGWSSPDTRPGMLLESYTSSGTLRWRTVKRSSQDEPGAFALTVDRFGTAVYAAGSSFGGGNQQFVTVDVDAASGTEVWTARSRAATSYTVGDGKSRAPHAVAGDAAGNTYVAGRKWNGTTYDMYVVSYGPAGGLPRWEQAVSGPAGLNDWAYALTLAPGGLLIVTGVTEAANHSLDYLTVCYTTAGAWQWTQVKDGAGHDDDVARRVVTDYSGRVFVTGWSWGTLASYSDFLTVAYDAATGAELWATTADGAAHANDQAADIVCGSGSVFVTGSSLNASATTDVMTVKYNPATGVETGRAVTSMPGYNVPFAILSAASAIYVTGATTSGGTSSCLTIKYDSLLTQVWQDVVASQSPGDAAGRSLAYDGIRNIVYVAGYGTNSAGNRDFLTIRYTDSAAPGQPAFTDYSAGSDAAYAVDVDANGIAFFTGVSDDGVELRMMTAAFQPTGNLLWTHRVGGSTYSDGQGFAVAWVDGRGAVVAGPLNDSYDCIRTIAYTFSVPTITAGTPLARTAGGTPQVSALATVSDPQDPGPLVVTATSVPSDLTLTNMNIAYGTVNATVAATCSATAGAKTIALEVRNSGYVTMSRSVIVNVTANTTPVIGTYTNRTILTGQPIDVSASAPPSDNGTVTLNAAASAGFIGTVSVNSSDGKVSIVNPGPGNGTVYTMTVTGTDNCGLAATARTFTLQVNGIAPPSNARATATSTSAVHLTWDAPGGAVSYDIWRKSLGGSFGFIANVGTNAYDNTGLSSATTYLYRVTARDGSGASTYQSNVDLATTILFTDDPLQAGSTVVKAAHFAELRTAVNAVRAAAGLSPIAFSPPALSGLAIASSHLTDLRFALNAALTALLLPPLVPAYPATPGTPIRVADVREIRDAVK